MLKNKLFLEIEMIKIKKAKESDIKESLKIAKSLNHWFDNYSCSYMALDFKVNNLVVAVDRDKVAGFLCYCAREGSLKIDWLGVKAEYQHKGVGRKFLDWLGKKAKDYGIGHLQVETLSNKYTNKYYSKTREFYYKQGFKKIYDMESVYKSWSSLILLEKRLK